MNTTTNILKINTRVSHEQYGPGTVVEAFKFAHDKGLSYKVSWDEGGPMVSGNTSWEKAESLTVAQD